MVLTPLMVLLFNLVRWLFVRFRFSTLNRMLFEKVVRVVLAGFLERYL